MVDVDNILTAVIAKLHTGSELALLAGKIFTGQDTVNLAKPYGRLVFMSGSPDLQYNGNAVDHCLIQFDVFATSLATANALNKAAMLKLAGQILVLSGQTMVHCVRRNYGVMVEGKETTALVYHSFSLFEFVVDN